MNYHHLFSSSNLALLRDWLVETGELYVDVHLPHSGASGNAYIIHSINDLKLLVARQPHPEIVISIFHHLQYPIRGVANESLLKQAIQQIPDGEWYTIISLEDVYPSPVVWWGSGNSHQELRREFTDLLGKNVGIGINPADASSGYWHNLPVDEVLTFSALRNQTYHQPKTDDPE